MKKIKNENQFSYAFNEEKGKDRLLKRMMNAYRKKKREEKVEKLKNAPRHWKGLE